MSFNVGANTSIGDTGIVIPGQYTSRTNLPTGAAAYLAYVTDTNEFVLNTQQVVHPSSTNTPPAPTTTNSPDNGVTWYKFRVKPMDFKNEVILEQGTLGGGYSGSGSWTRIERINFAADVSNTIGNMSFASRYAWGHSTYLYAYYQQGDNQGGDISGRSCKQDWATFTVTTITSRPNTGGYPTGYQFGPKLQNLYGFTITGGAASYLTFSNDVWTSFTPAFTPRDQSGSATAFGPSFAYYHNSASGSYKMTPANFSGSAMSSSPPNGGGYNGGMATKWNKHYAASQNASTAIDVMNQLTDVWTNGAGRSPSSMGEFTPITGQDWGYWFAYYAGYTGYCQKQLYATDTTVGSSLTNLQSNTGNSASGCWGPMP